MSRSGYQVAIVWWLDAYYAEEHDRDPGAMQVSAGLLLQNDSHAVKLALIADEWEARDVLTIPRGMVKHVKVLGQ